MKTSWVIVALQTNGTEPYIVGQMVYTELLDVRLAITGIFEEEEKELDERALNSREFWIDDYFYQVIEVSIQ